MFSKFLTLTLFLLIVSDSFINYPEIFYKLYLKAFFLDTDYEPIFPKVFAKANINFSMDYLCVTNENKRKKLKKYFDKQELSDTLEYVLNNMKQSDIKDQELNAFLKYDKNLKEGYHLYYYVSGIEVAETYEKCLMIEEVKFSFTLKKNYEKKQVLNYALMYEKFKIFSNNTYFNKIVYNLKKSLTVGDTITWVNK